MKIFLFVTCVVIIGAVVYGCSQIQNNNIVGVDNEKILDGTTRNIQFRTDKEKVRFQKMFDNINNSTDARWKTRPFESHGNFYKKQWCKRAEIGEFDCEQTNNITKGMMFKELSVLFYDKDLPVVFGIGSDALYTLVKSGWGVSFSYREYAESIFQKHTNITFLQFDEASEYPIDEIVLGTDRSYLVTENSDYSVVYNTGTSEQSELELYLKSPESFKNRALKIIDQHYQMVIGQINKNKIKIDEYGEYKDDGVPPPVISSRNLTNEEKRKALGVAKEYFDKEKSIIFDEYNNFYQLFKAVSPFENVF
ncbi:MAG: hypothetical protein A2921_00340 [Candidatus Magasanikbacteria bacterium RIFCSPLOWO2_01_FULL_43_20b]|uniref:Uncharacterized protein n=1 Tax=Candidatus Magasanikbacteria bacterium RIFCSPLOWO2_12_FULL_43_12 TaxID=1798692 RepID=A0A1F6MRV6_9BACT|nr:MAG: hypothetical protein A3I93_01070 [Candidatus Magasanikbacteria bacterium RIFCSPLOWO2_02_FULL_43_22]OGH73186.1 MAG: hypothetical protein A2921_00340 [Candidatus Magasanikbacteria bacterium RIFCSPLOWO2_01_FULL_43_20b]OGH74394.1 MAG: hypothetical protein A3G00_04450 [Candidatus Magasanikbacteria bacterium RIFCSPLOWO2_12_FULL_43_12]